MGHKVAREPLKAHVPALFLALKALLEPKRPIKGGNALFRALSSQFHCNLRFSCQGDNEGTQSCLQVRQGAAGEISEG